jgi:head-tail adaptor
VARLTAGELRDRVAVQAKTTAADTAPGRTVTWPTVIDALPVRVVARSAGEAIRAAGVTSVVSYEVVARYRTDITAAGHRFTWLGKTLQILGVRLNRLEDKVTFDCVELA